MFHNHQAFMGDLYYKETNYEAALEFDRILADCSQDEAEEAIWESIKNIIGGLDHDSIVRFAQKEGEGKLEKAHFVYWYIGVISEIAREDGESTYAVNFFVRPEYIAEYVTKSEAAKANGAIQFAGKE